MIQTDIKITKLIQNKKIQFFAVNSFLGIPEENKLMQILMNNLSFEVIILNIP